jgi:hypothetical protein
MEPVDAEFSIYFPGCLIGEELFCDFRTMYLPRPGFHQQLGCVFLSDLLKPGDHFDPLQSFLFE